MISKNPNVFSALVVGVAVACAASIGCSEAASEAAAAEGGSDKVVAQVGETKITQQQLDAAVKVKNAKAYQAFYDARRAVLEELIRKEVLAAETVARGITEDELVQEATKDVPEATDAEVESFFNSNTSRMGGRTLEEMQPQIKTYLDNAAKQVAANEIMETLKKKYGVRLMLEPPRVEVQLAANDPSYGPEDAPIVLVEFSDFQ
jgi:hypothetical protein